MPLKWAFVTAMAVYGVPKEVLTDKRGVFTERFINPRPPGEVLLDRMCRENGIVHWLTKVRSPPTTGKIERLHQTLQDELLNVHGPLSSLEGGPVRHRRLAERLQPPRAASVAGHHRSGQRHRVQHTAQPCKRGHAPCARAGAPP